MGLFKKEKKQEETKMVRTQEKAYDEDEMEPMDDNDLEDEEPEPEFKPRGRPPVKMEQLKKAVSVEPQQDEPKIVEVAVNLELLNNKLNYLITQNNEILQRLKR